MKARGIMELENFHLAASTLIIDPGKNLQRMREPAGERLMANRVFAGT